MSKLNEMWAALSAYQPQADAAGHGISWANMCKQQTYAAAYAAAAAAYAADTYTAAYAAYAADTYAAAYAAYAADAAYVAAYAANGDASAYAAAYVEKRAQKAIDSINKGLIKPPQHQGELK